MLRKSLQKQYFLVHGDQPQTLKRDRKQMEALPDCCTLCPSCQATLMDQDLAKNDWVCPACQHHLRMKAKDRLDLLLDAGTKTLMFEALRTKNPLDFPGYEDKIKAYQEKTKESEAVVIARGKLEGHDLVLGVMEAAFMMGSMGSVVGERISRAAEWALEHRRPLILCTASGGARMQEGIFSLMQMAKTSAAIGRLKAAGLPYFVVLTDPTTGGVTASFAMLGDVILAEPGALIAFAGPRVIEQTIKQTLPEGFQSAEFLLDQGFVDMIRPRQDLKKTLGQLLKVHEVSL